MTISAWPHQDTLFRCYQHEGLAYQLHFYPDGEVVFGLTDGSNPRWQPEVDLFDYPGRAIQGEKFCSDDINALCRPLPLIRMVLRDFRGWLRGRGPYFFYCDAATGRKRRFYR